MKTNFLAILLILSLFIMTSCDNDDDNPNTVLTLNLAGLENLGDDYVYEGWLIVDGSPVTTGVFTVNDSGDLSSNTFQVDANTLANATMFVLSIEPAVDPDPAPAKTKILSGAFSGNTATVNIDSQVGDLSASSGKYFLATPTNGNANPLSGLWFIDNSSGMMEAGLKGLPTLEKGWIYEGWVVINGTPLSTGTFSSATGADDAAPFSGMMAGPAFPGEDFLVNAPMGMTFPTDLSGANVVVSIEPVPDNSTAPFTLKPLSGMVPSSANGGTLYDVSFSSNSFPSGSVTR